MSEQSGMPDGIESIASAPIRPARETMQHLGFDLYRVTLNIIPVIGGIGIVESAFIVEARSMDEAMTVAKNQVPSLLGWTSLFSKVDLAAPGAQVPQDRADNATPLPFAIAFGVQLPGNLEKFYMWTGYALNRREAYRKFFYDTRSKIPSVAIVRNDPPEVIPNVPETYLDESGAGGKFQRSFYKLTVLPLIVGVFCCFYYVFKLHWLIAFFAAILGAIPYVGTGLGTAGAIYVWGMSPWLAIPLFFLPYWMNFFLLSKRPSLPPSNDPLPRLD